MYIDRIRRRLVELSEMGIFDMDDVEPCTEEEIEALEGKLGFPLPGAVREFYLWGGRDFSSLFQGSAILHVADHMKEDYRQSARKILQEEGGDTAIVEGPIVIIEMDYNGQFCFVRGDAGDDPPVYVKNEQKPAFCSCARFSDFFGMTVELNAGVEEINWIDSQAELSEAAEQRARRIQHLLFSGDLQFTTIPDEVFELKELRSLNLVGKGLIELSPRIAALGFLKRLELARNSLSSLPMALAELDELEELDLSENQLSNIAGVLRKLPVLRFCNLRENPLSPEEIEELRSEMPEVEITFDQE
jgi:hypothetical protein